MIGNLDGKVAFITGATGEIGQQVARSMHASGAKLVLTDLDPAALARMSQDYGADCVTAVCDVTDEAQNEAAVAAGVKAFGKIDIAVLNAGIEGQFGDIGDRPVAEFDKVIAVNVRGVYLGLSKVMPRMKQQKGGSVVILSSVAGRQGTAGLCPYVTSKHAVIGMMKCAAKEGAPHGVRVNTVNPGPIETRMMRQIEKNADPNAPDTMKSALQQVIPMGRYGTAEEVAKLVHFLSSDDASYMTGNIYGVDGGMTA